MPTYKLLFIWVEGDDDERFFNKILVPKFLEKYSGVKIIKYAAMRKKKVDNFIKSMYSPPKSLTLIPSNN